MGFFKLRYFLLDWNKFETILRQSQGPTKLLTHEKILKILCYSLFKGTGTRDLIWLKVVSLDRSWLVGLTDDLKKF